MIPARQLGTGLAVLGALGLALWLIVPRLALPISFDGANTYLPMGARVLVEGFSFFGTQQSVMVAPLAYLYPALLGATESTVRWANIALYLATIVLAFDAARVAHSRAAGVAAAFLLSLSPTLRPYVADVITEPLFIFATVLWAACVAHVSAGTSRSSSGWIAAGALALSVATLTRPSVMMFAPLLALLFAARAWKASAAGRTVEWRLAILHAAAIVLPLVWVARNHVVFGLTSIATGSGAALWLGIDPLVDGFDPVYYGMDYDVGAVARDMSHLSIEGDRTLRAVAAVQLRDIPAVVLAQMFAHKAAAFLAFSANEMGEGLASQRAWRLVMLVFAGACLLWARGSRLVIALGAFVAYMVVIHLPALYHHRYSVGAIEAPLTLLAAVGIAQVLARPARGAAVAVAAALVAAAGVLQLQDAAPGSPHVDRVPGQLTWTGDVAKMENLSLEGATRLEGGRFALAPGAAIEVPVTGTRGFFPGDYSAAILGLSITPLRGQSGCEAVRLRYRTLKETAFAPQRVVRIPLDSDGRMHAKVVGTTHPLRLNQDGMLRLEFECAYPATLEMGKITLVAPRRALVYRQRWLEAREAQQ